MSAGCPVELVYSCFLGNGSQKRLHLQRPAVHTDEPGAGLDHTVHPTLLPKIPSHQCREQHFQCEQSSFCASSCVCLQKRHLAFSHHHHRPQFESVSSCGLPESPALLLWRRQGDGENIFIKGQASSRVSSGGKAFHQSPYLVAAPRRPHRCPAAPVSWALSSVPPPQGSLPLKWL